MQPGSGWLNVAFFHQPRCLEAFDFHLANASHPDNFPASVRTLASKALRENPDQTQIWRPAGEGWKLVLRDHREAAKAKWLDELNTPKTPQVIGLFKELIGLSNLLESWSWQRMTSQQASDKLDDA